MGNQLRNAQFPAMALWAKSGCVFPPFFTKPPRVLSPRPHSPRRPRRVVDTNSTSADHSLPSNMHCCFKSAMLLEGEDPLGPLLGKLPAEVLRLVLGHLTPFERALFARASGSCFRACEESGLGRAGVRRGDPRQAVKITEMVASRSMYEWTRREAGLDEEKLYYEKWEGRDNIPRSLMNEAAIIAATLGDLEYFKLRATRAQKFKV